MTVNNRLYFPKRNTEMGKRVVELWPRSSQWGLPRCEANVWMGGPHSVSARQPLDGRPPATGWKSLIRGSSGGGEGFINLQVANINSLRQHYSSPPLPFVTLSQYYSFFYFLTEILNLLLSGFGSPNRGFYKMYVCMFVRLWTAMSRKLFDRIFIKYGTNISIRPKSTPF